MSTVVVDSQTTSLATTVAIVAVIPQGSEIVAIVAVKILNLWLSLSLSTPVTAEPNCQ